MASRKRRHSNIDNPLLEEQEASMRLDEEEDKEDSSAPVQPPASDTKRFVYFLTGDKAVTKVPAFAGTGNRNLTDCPYVMALLEGNNESDMEEGPIAVPVQSSASLLGALNILMDPLPGPRSLVCDAFCTHVDDALTVAIKLNAPSSWFDTIHEGVLQAMTENHHGVKCKKRTCAVWSKLVDPRIDSNNGHGTYESWRKAVCLRSPAIAVLDSLLEYERLVYLLDGQDEETWETKELAPNEKPLASSTGQGSPESKNDSAWEQAILNSRLWTPSRKPSSDLVWCVHGGFAAHVYSNGEFRQLEDSDIDVLVVYKKRLDDAMETVRGWINPEAVVARSQYETAWTVMAPGLPCLQIRFVANDRPGPPSTLYHTMLSIVARHDLSVCRCYLSVGDKLLVHSTASCREAHRRKSVLFPRITGKPGKFPCTFRRLMRVVRKGYAVATPGLPRLTAAAIEAACKKDFTMRILDSPRSTACTTRATAFSDFMAIVCEVSHENYCSLASDMNRGKEEVLDAWREDDYPFDCYNSVKKVMPSAETVGFLFGKPIQKLYEKSTLRDP